MYKVWYSRWRQFAEDVGRLRLFKNAVSQETHLSCYSRPMANLRKAYVPYLGTGAQSQGLTDCTSGGT